MQNSIVFLHGSGGSASIWRLQTDYLGPERATAIDLPGHGQRADTLPAEASVQDYARAAHEIITQELHIARPVIAGHSLGGAVALMMALDYGRQLAGLILIGTGARLRVHPDLLEDARQAPHKGHAQILELSVTLAHVNTVLPAIQQEQPASRSNMLYRDLAACNVFDIMPRLSEISLPTLIICGDDDRLTPAKYSQYMHQHIADSTLCIVPEAGHYAMREQPQAVNVTIEQWLQQL